MMSSPSMSRHMCPAPTQHVPPSCPGHMYLKPSTRTLESALPQYQTPTFSTDTLANGFTRTSPRLAPPLPPPSPTPLLPWSPPSATPKSCCLPPHPQPCRAHLGPPRLPPPLPPSSPRASRTLHTSLPAPANVAGWAASNFADMLPALPLSGCQDAPISCTCRARIRAQWSDTID
jgi:hypothetical protein